jgi:hypothetical protein
MRDNNITTVTTDERRVGDPTFYGQQYMYADEAARKKAAFMDFALVMAGLGRALNDYSQMGLILAPPPGTELKRFDNTGLGVLQYFAAGNLSPGDAEICPPPWRCYYMDGRHGHQVPMWTHGSGLNLAGGVTAHDSKTTKTQLITDIEATIITNKFNTEICFETNELDMITATYPKYPMASARYIR